MDKQRNMFLQKIRHTVERYALFSPGDSVLIALSGGCDSVCLLSVLSEFSKSLHLKLMGVHVNHQLRGMESDRDEAFVKLLCKGLGLPLTVIRADVASYAKKHKTGTEEAGRLLRYEAFERVRQENGFQWVATAHHADDNVETVFMRFLRGTGIRGLAGIPCKTESNIIRPLLEVTRQEIEEYAHLQGLDYVTDSTNGLGLYTRNKVRLDLIPHLKEEYNPNLTQTLKQNINHYRECADFLLTAIDGLTKTYFYKKHYGGYFLLSDLHKLHPYAVKSMFQQILEALPCENQITGAKLDLLLELADNGAGTVCVSGEITVYALYEKLYFVHTKQKTAFCYQLDIPGKLTLPETGQTLTASLEDNYRSSASRKTVYLDTSAVKGSSLTIRSRKNGDFFYPHGLNGKKKLKDYFIDEKVPVFLRDAVPLVLSGEDIIWVAGFRADERACSRAAGNYLKLCITGENADG